MKTIEDLLLYCRVKIAELEYESQKTMKDMGYVPDDIYYSIHDKIDTYKDVINFIQSSK
jgi:hypothetical protein